MVAQVLLSYYDILGLDRSACEKEIRLAHRKKAEVYHPDKVFHLGEKERRAAEMEMKLINNARDILLDQEQRELYDQYLDGALDAEEVEEAFIVVEEFTEEDRSPLWKKAVSTISQRWEQRIKGLKERTGIGREKDVLEAREVLEVEPLEEEKNLKASNVIIVKALDDTDEKPKKKKKSKPFEVIGVVDGKNIPDEEIDEDFVD